MKRLFFAVFVSMLVCCTDYQPKLDELKGRIDELNAACAAGNLNVDALQKMVDAIKSGDRAVSFIPVEDGGAVTGFIVNFEKAGMVTVSNHSCGVSVVKEDGRYYWAENGSVMVRDGKKVEIAPETAAPRFRIDGNALQISLDGGVTWSGAASFEKDMISGVGENSDAYIIEMASGEKIVIEKAKPFGITFGSQPAVLTAEAPSTSIPYSLHGGTSGLEVLAIAPDGMTAKAVALSADGGTVEVTAMSAEADTTVTVTVSDGKGTVVMERLAVLMDRGSFMEPENPENPDAPDDPVTPDEPVLPELRLEVEFEDYEMCNNQKEDISYIVTGAVDGCSIDVLTKGDWTYKLYPRTDSTGFVNVWCAGILSSDPIVVVASDGAGRRDTVEVMYSNLVRKVSVMGDSYSAFDGASVVPYYPRMDVTSITDMWWYPFTHRDGYKQEKVIVWSGSTICGTGYDGINAMENAFCGARLRALGHPDIVLVCGATNDSWAGSPIGSYKYSQWTELDLFSFRPALAYMFDTMYDLYGENLEIYFLLNNDLSNDIDVSVRTICRHYGVGLIELENIEKRPDHPTKKGQQQMYEQLMAFINGRE